MRLREALRPVRPTILYARKAQPCGIPYRIRRSGGWACTVSATARDWQNAAYLSRRAFPCGSRAHRPSCPFRRGGRMLHKQRPAPQSLFSLPLTPGSPRAYLLGDAARTGRAEEARRRNAMRPLAFGRYRPRAGSVCFPLRLRGATWRVRTGVGEERQGGERNLGAVRACLEHFTLEMLARICRQILSRQIGVGGLCPPLSDYLKRKLL